MLKTVEELEAKLSEPSEALIADVARISGDFMVLGAGGKMGPSLCHLLLRAVKRAEGQNRITAVSRFTESEKEWKLKEWGIETLSADLLDEEQLRELPHAENIIYMIGYKFGSSENEHLTWALNSYLPGRVAETFRDSRITFFSTGNIYPLTEVVGAGSTEDDSPGPLGEYAQSCLGRERVFEHFSRRYDIPACALRLNYAIELRYGVLLDIARAVWEGKPLDLRMGHANVIWQGDANAMAIRSLNHCKTPPNLLNITGPEIVSVRWAARYFAEKFGKEPRFENEEKEKALLSNASRAHALFGYPRVSLLEMMDWIADWVISGGEMLGKPTHFQEREGEF